MIGIGICTFNRNKILNETISKIRQFTSLPYKLVIVDDGSPISAKQATFRFEKNQGSPIAKNKCLELLDDCEHIFLFDDDTYPIKEGWQQAYIGSGVKHLNYTFKYQHTIVDNMRHLENPNGCMMYIHSSVLKKVGGFDTGFIKYGYWHGAYSNRVFNAGLIPHPFMDLVDSKEYIYCHDQSPGNRSATLNRSSFIPQNRRRYHEKIDSTEYISYKGGIKIRYSNPFATDKNIGGALNEFCEVWPDDNWICLQDGDINYIGSDWGEHIEYVIKNHGHKYGLIGCMTNRLGRPIQRLGRLDDNHDMLYHYEVALEEKEKHYGEVEDITHKKYVAGMFMLFPKKVWNEVKFPENNISFDDAFSLGVVKKGYKLGLMKGLYVYHFYRGWSKDPIYDRKHLK